MRKEGKRQPTRRQPILQWVPDEEHLFADRLARERVGQPESAHALNTSTRIDLGHAVIGCGRCGGVRGGDGIVIRHGVMRGCCPTKRCSCPWRNRP